MNITYKQNPIHVEVSGEGQALVLLHGFLENNTIWKPLLAELTKKHQVITIDLFGHGETPKFGYIHSMEEMAKAVAAVLAELKVASAIFIGHSMGGYVTLAFAELFPKKLKQLILLNSTSVADSEERQENRDRAKRLVKMNKEAFVSMSIKNLFAEETRKEFRAEILQMVAAASAMPAENIIATLEGLKTRKDRTEVLKNFRGKKTIITGKKDTVVPYQEIQEVAEVTKTELITFPNGHMGYIENRSELTKILQDILK